MTDLAKILQHAGNNRIEFQFRYIPSKEIFLVKGVTRELDVELTTALTLAQVEHASCDILLHATTDVVTRLVDYQIAKGNGDGKIVQIL